MWSWDKVDNENENIRKVTDRYERLQHMTHDSTQCGHRRKFIVVPLLCLWKHAQIRKRNGKHFVDVFVNGRRFVLKDSA